MAIDLVTPLVAAVGGVVVGWVAHYLYSHPAGARRSRLPAPPDLVPRPPPAGPPPTDPVGPAPTPSTGPYVWTTVGPAAPSPPPAPAGAGTPAPAVPLEEGLPIARQVILHLARLGRLGVDEVAPVGFTQQGMVAALGVRQGSLVRVLQRLKAANVVEVDRRHVSGIGRRLLVYRLTALGESVARDLRHPPPSAGARASAPPSGAWIAPRTPGLDRRV